MDLNGIAKLVYFYFQKVEKLIFYEDILIKPFPKKQFLNKLF